MHLGHSTALETVLPTKHPGDTKDACRNSARTRCQVQCLTDTRINIGMHFQIPMCECMYTESYHIIHIRTCYMALSLVPVYACITSTSTCWSLAALCSTVVRIAILVARLIRQRVHAAALDVEGGNGIHTMKRQVRPSLIAQELAYTPWPPRTAGHHVLLLPWRLFRKLCGRSRTPCRRNHSGASSRERRQICGLDTVCT